MKEDDEGVLVANEGWLVNRFLDFFPGFPRGAQAAGCGERGAES